MKRYAAVMLAVMCICLLAACQKDPKQPEMQNSQNDQEDAIETSTDDINKVTVSLMNEDNAEVGEAILEEKPNGVEITVSATHLNPGLHGFHIHEAGICEGSEFESAGGHFNPNERSHGFENEQGAHDGDIENLLVEEEGIVHQTFFNEHVTLKKGVMNSLLNENGTSLIIHEVADDYSSQPAGNAGKRIACGVIGEKQSD